jgi:hypothetical protein
MVKDSVLGAAVPTLIRLLASKPAAATYGLAPNPKAKGKLRLGPNPRTFWSAGYGGQLALGDPDAQVSLAGVFSDYTPGLEALHPKVLDAVYASL